MKTLKEDCPEQGLRQMNKNAGKSHKERNCPCGFFEMCYTAYEIDHGLSGLITVTTQEKKTK